MPSTGAPGNIWYPDDTMPVSPLENLFLQLATSVNTALSAAYGPSGALMVADLNALPAAAGFPEGRYFHIDSMNIDYQQRDGVWVQVGVAEFATTAARDTEYAKASAAYRVTGARSRITTELFDRRWDGSAWRPWGMSWYPIVPVLTAVGSGSSASVDAATGRGVFAACTSLVVASIFATEFKNFRIIIDNSAASASSSPSLNLRNGGAGGTDSTTGYDSQGLFANNNVASASQLLNQGAWLTGVAQGAAGIHRIELELTRPADATQTIGKLTTISTLASMTTAAYDSIRGIEHRPTTAYTDLDITSSAGTIGGAITIEGHV